MSFELVFMLEEPSARALLEQLIPRLLPGIDTRFIVFEGKQDMDKQLERKLRHYQSPHARFVVLRDQDSADCRHVKQDLLTHCLASGRKNVLIRIACRELESWYLGDLQAVERALGVPGLGKRQQKKKFRDPDSLGSPSNELKKITNNRYQKIAGSRSIAEHLDLNNRRSRSFGQFVTGLHRLACHADLPNDL